MRKLKLFLMACALIGWVGQVKAQTAWTADITNGDGLALTKSYAGFSSGDVQEMWSSNATNPAIDLNQSFTGMPDGVYELSAQAMYRASLTYGTSTNCVLYATVGEKEYTTPIANFGDWSANENLSQVGTQMKNNLAYTNTLPCIIVKDGSATVGIKSVGALTYCTNGYWFIWKKSTFTFKNVTTSYHAALLARANTMLSDAPESDEKTALSTAVSTYTEATLANVEALQAAINAYFATASESTPVNVTSYITNPSFEDNTTISGSTVNSKNWIQDMGYKQPSEIVQPIGWNMLYSSAKVDNTQWQTYRRQTDGAKNGKCLYVRHRWGDVNAVVSYHQLVKELPAGQYKLTVAVKGTTVTDPNTLSITAGSNSNTTNVNSFTSEYQDYSVEINKATDDCDIDISYGWNQQTGGEQLYYIDDFRLYCTNTPLAAAKKDVQTTQATATSLLEDDTYVNIVGTERATLLTKSTASAAEETAESYNALKVEVQEAIDAFTAAKTNYDLLVTEIAKAKALGIAKATADGYAATSESTAATALTNTQNLMVAEYEYVSTNYKYSVELGTWSETNIISRTGQHWDGTAESGYKEMNVGWGNTSWTMSMNQDLTLPAGNYVLKAAGRHASGNCQLSLVVKNGDEVIGTVADFPKGDTGLGINTSGETDFTTGEGHTYANGGTGRGFQWRYVKFTLDADATVNVAVAGEGNEIHQWVSFCNATVETDNEANISLIAYNISLASANTTINNTDYANVTGSEKTALQAAIDADGTLDKTDADAIDAAKTALDNAVTAFTAAKSAYDTYVAAKAVVYEDNLPYASSTKFAAIATAQGAGDATSADDATTKTNAILSAYRLYVESNALAEGVTGAEQITIQDPNMDVAYDSENHKFGAWQVIGQTDGTIQLLTEQSFTDGDGNSNYKYADIWKSDNNAGIQQTVNLPAGRYLLTVTARAQNTDGATFRLFAGANTTDISRINATGGVFDRGWNDVSLVFDVTQTSDVNIGVQSGNGKSMWWSATRFRLVKIADVVLIAENANYTPAAAEKQVVVLNRTIKAEDTWNTFVVPFNITNAELISAFGEDVAVAEYSDEGESADAVTVSFNKMATPAITANVPVLLKVSTAKTSVTFENRTIVEGTLTLEGNYFDFVGSYAASTEIASGDYYLSANQIFKSKGLGSTIAGTRAYIKAKTTGARISQFSIGEDTPTVIDGVQIKNAQNNGDIYNLNGQKMNKQNLRKGLYIINGRKVVK